MAPLALFVGSVYSDTAKDSTGMDDFSGGKPFPFNERLAGGSGSGAGRAGRRDGEKRYLGPCNNGILMLY